MTARLLKESVRATSWLASWVDYGIAMALVAGRLIRIPTRATPVEFEPAYMRLATEGYEGCGSERVARPHWNGPERPSQHWLVRPAEIVMLSASFFLAAHLISGGTSSVSAPQVNPFALISTSASAGQVSTKLIPSATSMAPGATVTVPVESASDVALAATALEDTAPAVEPAPAAAPDPGLQAATLPAAENPAPEPAAEVPAPAPAPPVETAPPAAPAPAPVAPVAAVSSVVLSYDELIAAATTAGWPAERLDEVARVAWCESRFRSDAVGYGTYGLMQLIPFWFEVTGTDFALWSDPVTNLRVALYAFSSNIERGAQPWGPWSCKPEHIVLP